MALANFIGHETCPRCGGSDPFARYDDGSAVCFSQGCGYREKAGSTPNNPQKKRRTVADKRDFIEGTYKDIPARKLNKQTCRKWGYETAKYPYGERKNQACQVANYCDNTGEVIAQKVRFPDKQFTVIGDLGSAGFYGQHLWSGGRILVITEGEVDALTVSQLQDGKWPVVSLPSGAGSAKKTCQQQAEWLEQFQSVVFMLDQDKEGREAAKEAAEVLSPGKAFIATLPYKDANECHTNGAGGSVLQAIWEAQEFRPDGIIRAADIAEQAKKPVEWGYSWAWDFITQWTYGRRQTEVYTIGAGTGVGKTDFLTQQIDYDINTLGEKVGVFYLEQKPTETLKRIAGKAAGQAFHVPDGGWSQEDLESWVDQIASHDKLFLYDNFGSTDWDAMKSRIRFLAQSEGVKLFYIDHLTALADTEEERESLEKIMKSLAMLAEELEIVVHLVSHLATPDGKPHEEGGRVMVRHFKGSRAIGFWSYFMFGLERDGQAEDEEDRHTTTVRSLKDRYTGRSQGCTAGLKYCQEDGRLYEAALPEKAAQSSDNAEDHGSTDEDEEPSF